MPHPLRSFVSYCSQALRWQYRYWKWMRYGTLCRYSGVWARSLIRGQQPVETGTPWMTYAAIA